GGGVNWTYNDAGSFMRLQKGFMKVGVEAGTVFAGGTTIAPVGNTFNSDPIIYSGGNQTAPVFESGLIDFASAFSTFRSRSTDLAACPTNAVLTSSTGGALPPTIPPGTSARLTLTPGVQNVLNITAANLRNITTLTFPTQPSASTPLVINVDTAGVANAFAWTPPLTSGLSFAGAPYLLWNFPTATSVTESGTNEFFGTFYAPRATLTIHQTADLLGSAI